MDLTSLVNETYNNFTPGEKKQLMQTLIESIAKKITKLENNFNIKVKLPNDLSKIIKNTSNNTSNNITKKLPLPYLMQNSIINNIQSRPVIGFNLNKTNNNINNNINQSQLSMLVPLESLMDNPESNNKLIEKLLQIIKIINGIKKELKKLDSGISRDELCTDFFEFIDDNTNDIHDANNVGYEIEIKTKKLIANLTKKFNN